MLWVATRDNGVARWTGHDFERFENPQPGRSVDLMTLDDEGNVWIGMPGRGYVLGADGGMQPIPWIDPRLGVPVLNMLLRDRHGAHWLDTRSGMARHWEGRVQDVPLYSHASRGVVRPSWSSALEDREGGLWFGSTNYAWHVPANWRNFTVLTRRDTVQLAANAHARHRRRGQGRPRLVGRRCATGWAEPLSPPRAGKCGRPDRERRA